MSPWLGLFLFLMCCIPTQATEVALVLSGGGARGISEVGVLQVLEEQHIPVSCVVGTSMGAIVGAAYASGMDPESMPEVLSAVDWSRMFASRSPRRFLPYAAKRDDWQTDFDFTLRLQGWRVLPPVHLINVQNIDMFFRQLVGYTPVMSFDHLPLPFRAIATDLNHGGTVAMDHGDLPLVMRASMTVPGAFPPVDYQGRLVVDGGLADNLPVDVGRQLCGQAVIAVDVTTPSEEDKQPGSILEVAQQVINQALQQNVRQQKASLKPGDVLIVPDLKAMGSFDFDETALLIQRGRLAAEAVLDQLRRYQVSEQEYRLWKAHRQARRVGVPRVSHVILSPLKRANAQIVMSQLDVHPGMNLNAAALQESIARIYAQGDFERVGYHLEKTDQGDDVMIDVKELPGNSLLRMGVQLTTNFDELSFFELNADLRKPWMNALGGEWRLQGQLGESQRAYAEFNQPLLTNGALFLAPDVYFQSLPRDVVVNGQRVTQLRNIDSGTALELGSALDKWGEWRGGVVERHITTAAGTDPQFAYLAGAYNGSGYRVQINLDQMDATSFPHSGWLLRGQGFASSQALGAQRSFRDLGLDVREALSWRGSTVLWRMRWGTSAGSHLPDPESYFLGGIMNLSAWRRDELTGNQLILGQINVYQQINALPAGVGKGVYAGLLMEEGGTSGNAQWSQQIAQQLHNSESIWLGADTLLGPLYLSVAQGDHDHKAAYLSWGVTY